jgi:hypothetical protein
MDCAAELPQRIRCTENTCSNVENAEDSCTSSASCQRAARQVATVKSSTSVPASDQPATADFSLLTKRPVVALVQQGIQLPHAR